MRKAEALALLLLLAAGKARAEGELKSRPTLTAPPPLSKAQQQKPQVAVPDLHFITLPGGTYTMGTDDAGWAAAKPAHRVTVKSFQLAKTVVTYKQYQACVDAGACTPIGLSDGSCWVFIPGVDGPSAWKQGVVPANMLGDDHPAVCADWFQANAYAKWAGGRLPTEAEWEYAARSAGKDWKYPWGNEQATCERAVMDDGGNGCGTNGTMPVCSKPKGMTEQGLCDMAGNDWEWTADWFHDNYEGAPTDGTAWLKPEGVMRVGRGGSWNDFHWLLRSSFRNAGYPADRCAAGSFRVARDLP